MFSFSFILFYNRCAETNGQNASRGSNPASNLGHNATVFIPYIDSARSPDLRYLHQNSFNASHLPFRDMQYTRVSQSQQIEARRSPSTAPTQNPLSVTVKPNAIDSTSSRPRMSLLPHGTEYIPYRASSFSFNDASMHNATSMLKVDTRDYANSPSVGTYHPMVEAISPTGEETAADELASAKNELHMRMSKLDSEISETEKIIAQLKKKEHMLQESTQSKSDTSVEENNELLPKHRSLAQKIYAENRKKAAGAHSVFNTLCGSFDYPLYNQPQDADICKEIRKRHETFKDKLVLHLKLSKAKESKGRAELIEKYSALSQEWYKRVEKIESSMKKKTREAKHREFFEKVFPELRKQREDKERFNRVGSRIKSEADVEEIIDGLQEQVSLFSNCTTLSIFSAFIKVLNYVNKYLSIFAGSGR